MEQFKYENNMLQIKKDIEKYILLNGGSHILVHSDVLFGLKVKFENQEQYLEEHCLELMEICKPLDIIMPSFNYDFCQGKTFNVETDESQVGTLSEYFRKNISTWRTSIPVFNFSGTGSNPISNVENTIDPFDNSSLFSFLNNNKGMLMHYGSGFHTTTLIHYVERISNKLIYRYNKEFIGDVIELNKQRKEIKLVYHVRPMGFSLDYDWDKLEQDLINENILLKFKKGRTQIMIARIDKIVEFWLSKLKFDSFYFINSNTRKLVEQKYKEFKRPFLLNDFE
jgi:aminoglycoside 3-N-acetyltransferase